MMHLPVHLAEETKIGGPVCYRWMYPIERYLRTLKGYVRNKAHPEGSIAEGYISEECMTFCSRFLEDIDTKLDRPTRHERCRVNEPRLGIAYLGASTTVRKAANLSLFLDLTCCGCVTTYYQTMTKQFHGLSKLLLPPFLCFCTFS